MPAIEISHTTPIAFGATPNAKVERVEIDFLTNKVRVVWHYEDPSTGNAIRVESATVDLKTLIPVGSPLIATICARIMAVVVGAKGLAGAAVATPMDPSVTTP